MFDSCQELSEIIRFSQCQPFLRLLVDYFMNRAIFQPYEAERELGLDYLSLSHNFDPSDKHIELGTFYFFYQCVDAQDGLWANSGF